jgi:putative ABC transport system permease protein
MLTNWFVTAIRNMFRNKTYSLLNIFGLAIGIACACLIFLWVEDERLYDSTYPKRDRLYSIVIHHPMDGKIYTFGTNSTPKLLAPSLRDEIPAISNTARLSWASNHLFAYDDRRLDQVGYYADSSVFSMFNFEFLRGRAADALAEVNNVVITEKTAKRFFGNNTDVIGKVFKVDNRDNMKVAGVIRDLPENSTLQFDWLGSMEFFLAKHTMSDWNSYSLNTYVELIPGADANQVNAQIKDLIRQKTDPRAGSPALLAMKDWRLRSNFEEGKQVGGRIEYVRTFSTIAVIILLIACINFMNIATAKSEKRAKEVGVRKVIGASRRLIILQFMGEAILLSAIAVAVGLLMISIALPQFSLLVEKQIHLGLNKPEHIAFLVAIVLVCGIFAGSYPALYLSSFRPVAVLKSLKLNTGNATLIRKGLVVVQFSVSIILIISTLVIYKQIQYVKNRDIGYDKDQLLTIAARGNVLQQYSSLRENLLKTGVVENVAVSSYNTIDFGNNTTSFGWAGKNPGQEVLISYREVSPGFIGTTGMKLVAGRDFYPDIVSDSMHVIITESLAKLMKVDNAVGKFIETPGRAPGDPPMRFEIVGVIRDYVYGNMYGVSEPVLLFCNIERGENIFVRLSKNSDTRDAIAALETVMKKQNPSYPFTFRFVDDHFNEQFRTEQLISKLARVFASLAVLISCLGLFGLSAYTAERRKREISIRKVLGADTYTIAALLSREFIVLIGVSLLVAFPAAFWIMSNWLQEYAYRIGISPWVFVVSAVIILFIALATISIQSLRAAFANPVKNLRSE